MGSRLRQDVKHFFECFCEVVGPKENSGAWIIQKFPESYKDESVLKSVPKFAFPCEFDKTIPQHYSFVLTNVDSKWTFGFCRHDPRSETALVVLTYLPWHEAFSKFLNDISELMQGACSDHLWKFLDLVYKNKIPSTGKDLSVLVHSSIKVFTYEAPNQFKLPSIPENRNLTEYYNAVDNHNMMVIFASMLYERRIIFTSKKLSRLSACVQSANALLYPMSWQHIFIPVLPFSLIEYLSAPMPYLIGLPHSLIKNVTRADLGDVVMLDADKNTVETPFHDLESLPTDVVHNLQKQLRNRASLLGDGVSRAFLRALVQLIGGYRDALKMSQGKNITFNEEAFVESRPSSIQPFLRKMLELQIFRQFIEERLSLLNAGLGFSDEFELEVCNYSDKSSSKLQQSKEWMHSKKREGTAFLKTVKNKANPAMKSAVQNFKARGKDVSSAYKGIRFKLKDKKSKPNSAPSSPTAGRAHTMLESKSTSSSAKVERPQFRFPENRPMTTSQSSDDLSPPKLNPTDLMDDLHDVIFRNLYTKSDENDNTAIFRHEFQGDRTLGSRSLMTQSASFETFGPSNSHDTESVDDPFQSPYKILPPPPRSENMVRLQDEPKDLIRLDSSSSFGDFDPLTNGDTFQASPPINSSNGTLSPTVGVLNPLYPYYTVSKKPQALKDSELLSEYGINFDKFSISSNNASTDTATSTVARSKSEWTKFD